MTARADVAIIGAGAAGLMAAIAAAARGRKVVVFDAGETPARKVRVAGGGRCNFTNLAAAPEHYVGANPMFTRSALTRFSGAHALRFFQDRGVVAFEMTPGRFFCHQGGGFVAQALLENCRELGVTIMTGARVEEAGVETRIEAGLDAGFADRFFLRARGELTRASSLIVAAGGPAQPKLQASADGFALARRFGLAVIAPRPALTSFTLGQDSVFAGLAGISLPVTLKTGARSVSEDLLFTHTGISGPAALDASCFWRPGETLGVDFLPGVPPGLVLDRTRGGRELAKNRLAGFLPQRLAARLIPPELAAKRLADLSGPEMTLINARLHDFQLTPAGLSGFSIAEVAAGGVDTALLDSKTMGVKGIPGLYFIGEVVDVTGLLGGFNLQWAWSSGWAAGQYA